MGDRDLSLNPTDREWESFRREVAANALPKKLLEILVAMVRTSPTGEMLQTTLQQTLDVSTELTQAEEGRIFLFDREGRASHWIFSRNESPPNLSQEQLEGILERGLTGWVKQYRQVGLSLDTEKDERWVDLDRTSYRARSALIVPILKEDYLLGILSLLHSKPGHFSSKTADLMQVTTNQIALVLHNAQLFAELTRQKKALDRELEMGQCIQQNFLPPQLPQYQGWEIAAFFKPARLLSGDFYDFFELPNRQLGIVIADVCDKGVGAALFMALFRSLIRIFSGQTALEGVSFNSPFTSGLVDKLSSIPAPLESISLSEKIYTSYRRPNIAHINALKAVRLTNNYIALNHGELSMFATLFFGVLDPKTGNLTYINAGHNPLWILESQGGVKESLEPTGPAVGLLPNLKFKIRQTRLEQGEMLLGYTDGVTEARAPGGEFFTTERLQKMVDPTVGRASTLLEEIAARVLEHTGVANQFDDITLLAVRREPSIEKS
ncbi:PP2C family protein-serine/threonine phosphatase [Lusitaniella coriacea]|uniref:PP2C family protein-serine/threonine phosphatase n=1 Tax=Lusitaniella coriacea TaxID=1983105 RepID=UPI003CF36885